MASSSDAQSRMSMETRMSVETYLCDCEKKAKLFTSRTARNPGRRFLGCGQPQGTRCNFFHWFDVEAAGRHGEVVSQLNDSRFILERKLADVEEKLAAKKQQTRALKRKNLMLGRMCFVLMMVVIAMAVLMFDKKMT